MNHSRSTAIEDSTAAPPPMGLVSDEEPSWARDLARLWWEEIRLFVSTAARFVASPRRFGAEWASGQRRAMNPLAFLAASWPILLPIDYGLQALARHQPQPNHPLIVELVRSIRPYIFAIPLTLILFAIFRLAGSRRHLTTTLGILLYWSVFSILGWIVGVVGNLAFQVGEWLPHVTGYLTTIWGAMALAGAHRIRWGWSLLAFVPSSLLAIRGTSRVLDWLGWS
jgi:hypothetical protein